MLGQFHQNMSVKSSAYTTKNRRETKFWPNAKSTQAFIHKSITSIKLVCRKKTYNCFAKITPQSSIEVLHLRKIKLLHFKIQSLPNPRLWYAYITIIVKI